MNKGHLMAGSTPDGKLYVTSNYFEYDIWGDRYQLFAHAEKDDYLTAQLVYAEFCRACGDERDALNTFSEILEMTVMHSKILHQYKELAEKAYSGLSRTVAEGSEYVWESGVGILDSYRHIFNGKS